MEILSIIDKYKELCFREFEGDISVFVHNFDAAPKDIDLSREDAKRIVQALTNWLERTDEEKV